MPAVNKPKAKPVKEPYPLPQVGLAGTLRDKASQPRPGPVWQGPCGEGPQGGITQGLLGRYLVCKERFRVLTIEGLKVAERFHAPVEFGNMWHVCEEFHAANQDWGLALRDYSQGLFTKYPLQQELIAEWHDKCHTLFPVYAEHWAKHPDVTGRTPLLQEQTFDVPYLLPSGRMVRLRGKWDSVDLIAGDRPGIWLQENKTKSSIDQRKLTRQLGFDLQMMVYLIALGEDHKADGSGPGYWDWVSDKLGRVVGPDLVKGVRYNVIRRSAHKTPESMLKKVSEDLLNGRIVEWFARWKVEVTASDIAMFKRECLDPELENLCDDYEWWVKCRGAGHHPYAWQNRAGWFPAHLPRHARRPFGIYDVLAEGGATDVDDYLATGSKVGLVQVTNLFPELQDG